MFFVASFSSSLTYEKLSHLSLEKLAGTLRPTQLPGDELPLIHHESASKQLVVTREESNKEEIDGSN